MASEEAAVTMMNYYTSAPPTIRNQPVFIQYSNHRELKTDNLTNQVKSTLSVLFTPLMFFLYLKSVICDCFFLLTESSAAGHQYSSNAFWDYGTWE